MKSTHMRLIAVIVLQSFILTQAAWGIPASRDGLATIRAVESQQPSAAPAAEEQNLALEAVKAIFGDERLLDEEDHLALSRMLDRYMSEEDYTYGQLKGDMIALLRRELGEQYLEGPVTIETLFSQVFKKFEALQPATEGDGPTVEELLARRGNAPFNSPPTSRAEEEAKAAAGRRVEEKLSKERVGELLDTADGLKRQRRTVYAELPSASHVRPRSVRIICGGRISAVHRRGLFGWRGNANGIGMSAVTTLGKLTHGDIWLDNLRPGAVLMDYGWGVKDGIPRAVGSVDHIEPIEDPFVDMTTRDTKVRQGEHRSEDYYDVQIEVDDHILNLYISPFTLRASFAKYRFSGGTELEDAEILRVEHLEPHSPQICSLFVARLRDILVDNGLVVSNDDIGAFRYAVGVLAENSREDAAWADLRRRALAAAPKKLEIGNVPSSQRSGPGAHPGDFTLHEDSEGSGDRLTYGDLHGRGSMPGSFGPASPSMDAARDVGLQGDDLYALAEEGAVTGDELPPSAHFGTTRHGRRRELSGGARAVARSVRAVAVRLSAPRAHVVVSP